jgi:hypothetical protein
VSSRMEFYGPAILDAIVKAGGCARIEDVYAQVFSRLSGRMPAEDFEDISSGSGEPKWKNKTRQTRRDMVNIGLLHPLRRHGYWETTVAGRQWHAERLQLV